MSESFLSPSSPALVILHTLSHTHLIIQQIILRKISKQKNLILLSVQIPEGDWFCSQCRPVEPRRSIRRSKTNEDSDGDDYTYNEERQDMKLVEMEMREGDGDEVESKSDEEDSDGKRLFSYEN